MKIAIIGAGFTGLSAAYILSKQKNTVTVFEKDAHPGGLAIGYKEKSWNWTLEHHYHHWFTNDDHILQLAKQINYQVLIKRPKTGAYVNGSLYQLDSPLALMLFPKLSLIERIRMAAVLAFLRFNPNWQSLEHINANAFLTKWMGKRAYGMLWEPQLRNKMGEFADDVSLVWFWSRIKKRTPSLAYPKGGFLEFAKALTEVSKKQGADIRFNAQVTGIKTNTTPSVSYQLGNEKTKTENFDKVIFTLPSMFFAKLASQLPDTYKHKLLQRKFLGATNLLLRLKKPFFPDNTYWLSICEKNAPIMVLVEHTHFMDKTHYDNEHLVYIGNYPRTDSERFTMDAKELLHYYDPFLQKIHPHYEKNIIGYKLFKAPFAQPIIPVNYSKLVPAMETPLKNIYLANIEQVYPWDRGTNYAVELGEKAAKLVI